MRRHVPFHLFRTIVTLLLIQALSPLSMHAQETTYKDTGAHTYVFAAGGRQAVGGRNLTGGQIGVGLEDYHDAFGVGFALELAASTPLEGTGKTFGLFSLNFPRRILLGNECGRVQPFVTGGYSLFFGDVAKSRINYGGGVLWWLTDTTGLRLEVRDHVPVTAPNRSHSWQIRAALAFPSEEGTEYLPLGAAGRNRIGCRTVTRRDENTLEGKQNTLKEIESQ